MGRGALLMVFVKVDGARRAPPQPPSDRVVLGRRVLSTMGTPNRYRTTLL